MKRNHPKQARQQPRIIAKSKKPAVTPKLSDKPERIAKVIARAGVCSRRDAEKYILEGRVSVNGNKLASPAFTVTAKDRVEVDGKVLQAKEPTRLFLFHKPAGCLTTTKDDKGRQTVFDVLAKHQPVLPRLVTVGRLDYNTEGLLLLTNDGELARYLEHPKNEMLRQYRVRAHGSITQERLDGLKDGVVVEGVHYGPVLATLEKPQGSNVWLAVSITEGKNREVRKIMSFLGLEVNRLLRVSYGPFSLGTLGKEGVKEYAAKALQEMLPGYFRE